MKKRLWIKDAVKSKGVLHRNLGIPLGHKIPQGLLRTSSKRHDKTGAEARLALTLEGLNHQHHQSKMEAKSKGRKSL